MSDPLQPHRGGSTTDGGDRRGRRSLERTDRPLLCLLWMALAAPAALTAQEPVDVEAAIACFERKVLTPRATCEPGTPSATVFLTSGAYPIETANLVLDGLERLALTADDEVVRVHAIGRIGGVGREEYANPAAAGTVARLERIYDGTSESGLRLIVVKQMLHQSERAEATEFLLRVARSEPEPQRGPIVHFTIPSVAVSYLARLGPEGRQALEGLDPASVPDPWARVELRRLLRQDQQMEPPR